ncbi:MAG: type I secretion system permease/ATPase [Alphaproteobacteria bacterium]|nr:type I secretion system permease/ATPase [Alphaproteobacteria bacterium]
MAGKAEQQPASSTLKAALDACRRHIGFVILFSACLNLLYLAPSIYMLQVYDRVLASGGVLTLVYLTLVLVASLAVLAFLDGTRIRLLLAMSRRLDRVLAPSVLRAALQREGRAAAGHASILREFDALRSALSGPPALAVVDAPWAPIYIAVCFLIHPWIGMLALLGGATLVAIALVNQRVMQDALKANEETAGAMYGLQSADSIQGDAARALGMQERLVERQLRMRVSLNESTNLAGSANSFYTATTKFTRLVLQSAALGLGAFLALRQDISAGGIIAASILCSRAYAPLELIVGAWRQFEQGRQAYGVITRVLRTQETQRDYTNLPEPRGILSVESVTVRAPTGDRFLLMNATFRGEPGDIIGVIGPSGAGKTTLLRAIAGAALPDGGAVRLDGAKMTDWDSDRLGRHVGYLPQEVALFGGTIGQNISRFDSLVGDGVDHAIVRAAQQAGAHDMILSLPRGYDTEIGPNGRGLSAGQAQRVALARALYGDPVLLALDEPNAHLDNDGETALINALREASARGVCSIIVAHRTGFLSQVNKLMIVAEGRIDAFGPRDAVLARINPGAGPRPVAVPNEGSRQ